MARPTLVPHSCVPSRRSCNYLPYLLLHWSSFSFTRWSSLLLFFLSGTSNFVSSAPVNGQHSEPSSLWSFIVAFDSNQVLRSSEGQNNLYYLLMFLIVFPLLCYSYCEYLYIKLSAVSNSHKRTLSVTNVMSFPFEMSNTLTCLGLFPDPSFQLPFRMRQMPVSFSLWFLL